MDNFADRSAEGPWVVGGLAVVGTAVVLVGALATTTSYDVAVAAVVFAALVVVSLPILRWIAQNDDDPKLFAILIAALLTKLVFSLVRYFVMQRAYGSLGDSVRYDVDGWAMAEAIRSGTALPAVVRAAGDEAGTGRIIQLTGYIYLVIGRSRFGAFFLYSWLAFWGLLLMVRGTCRGFPEVDRRRLTVMVLFFPSLLFWPSSIGKEAVMIFLLGLCAYGAGRLLGPSASLLGAVPFLLGLGGMMLVRPHVGLMAVLAMAAAVAFAVLGGGGRTVGQARTRSALVRAVALVVLVVAASSAAGQTSKYFTDKSSDANSTQGAFDLTLERTQTGGSSFDPVVVRTPVDIVPGTMSVLYRPFLWEANNFGNMIAAGEAILLAGLTLASCRRLLNLPGTLWRRPFVAFAVLYVLMFVVGFSNIANVGILARQRTQMIPFFLIVLCIPAAKWWREPATGPPRMAEKPAWAAPSHPGRGESGGGRVAREIPSGLTDAVLPSGPTRRAASVGRSSPR